MRSRSSLTASFQKAENLLVVWRWVYIVIFDWPRQNMTKDGDIFYCGFKIVVLRFQFKDSLQYSLLLLTIQLECLMKWTDQCDPSLQL